MKDYAASFKLFYFYVFICDFKMVKNKTMFKKKGLKKMPCESDNVETKVTNTVYYTF